MRIAYFVSYIRGRSHRLRSELALNEAEPGLLDNSSVSTEWCTDLKGRLSLVSLVKRFRYITAEKGKKNEEFT